MSGFIKFCKDEVQLRNVGVEHTKPPDFYLSGWQSNRSVVPLLVFRSLLFLTALAIILSSIVIYSTQGLVAYWLIYLTHWGLLSVLFSTGFSVAVSARCYFYGPISGEFSLPWYVKSYWTLYNIAVPLAFLITIFYWTVLYEAGIEEELNHGLDVAVHGLNSVVMFLLLVTSSVPSRLLHVYQPLIFAICYVIFGVIYYLAGGTDTYGNPWVYPVVDWSNPGLTIGVVALTGLLLVVVHVLIVGLAVLRDAVTKKYIKPTVIVHVDEGMPLRQTAVP